MERLVAHDHHWPSPLAFWKESLGRYNGNMRFGLKVDSIAKKATVHQSFKLGLGGLA